MHYCTPNAAPQPRMPSRWCRELRPLLRSAAEPRGGASLRRPRVAPPVRRLGRARGTAVELPNLSCPLEWSKTAASPATSRAGGVPRATGFAGRRVRAGRRLAAARQRHARLLLGRLALPRRDGVRPARGGARRRRAPTTAALRRGRVALPRRRALRPLRPGLWPPPAPP